MCLRCDQTLGTNFYTSALAVADSTCVAARCITANALSFNQQMLDAIRYAGMMFLSIHMFNPKLFDLDECGVEGRGASAPNTWVLGVSVFLYLFVYMPVYKKQLAERRQGPEEADFQTGDYTKILSLLADTALTAGFNSILIDRQDLSVGYQVALYAISSRNAVIAVLSLLKLHVNKETIAWYHNNVADFIKGFDLAVARPCFNADGAAAAAFAFVVSFIDFYFNARRETNLPNTYTIGLMIALLTALVMGAISYVNSWLDAKQLRLERSGKAAELALMSNLLHPEPEGEHPVQVPAHHSLRLDQKTYEVAEAVVKFGELQYFIHNFMMTWTVCRNPNTLTAAGFKMEEATVYGISALMISLAIINELAKVKLPGLPTMGLPFRWPHPGSGLLLHQKKQNFLYGLRWIFYNAFGVSISVAQAREATSLRQLLSARHPALDLAKDYAGELSA